MTESLTAADFARCAGRDTTPAMEAEVLVEANPLPAAEAVGAALIASVDAGQSVPVADMISARREIWRAADWVDAPAANAVADRLSAEIERASAPVVPPEVRAVLDARAALAVAEKLLGAASVAFAKSPNFSTADAIRVAEDGRHAAFKALRAVESACYVPGATEEEDARAKWARHDGIRNEIGAVQFKLETATKKGQSAAIARHTAALEALRAELAAFDAAHGI